MTDAIPDPGLTLEEALTINGVVMFAAEAAERFKNDVVLNSAYSKIRDSANEYHHANPGALDAIQKQQGLRKLLDQDR